MDEFFSKTFYGNTVEQWFYSLLFVLGGILFSKAIYWVIKEVVKKLTAKTKTNIDDALIGAIEKPVVYGIVLTGMWMGFNRLTFPEGFENFMHRALMFVLIFNITWLIVRAIDALIGEILIPLAEKSENTFDDQIVPILRTGVKVLLWIIGLIVALDNAGFDIMALIAGLGIGGLALALAAQDTVKNIFGGVMIFIDKPFQLGDWVVIGGDNGIVEEVGIRSTRIRTLEGRLVTVPNSKFAESSVTNNSAEPTRKVVVNLGLVYDTSPEKMDAAMNILKDIIKNNNEIVSEDCLVSFNSWGEFSLGILFIYYIRKEADILKAQSKINLEVLKRFNENGLEFAYPTQTIYKK
ncbi:MAG TPA: mechanosensitive ion channel family protein [Clostridiales bacterium]|jgi:MscS family membrane protein|nr:mechanosensitive ion channel family protein [Clostridiales bacterium]HQP69310.1 mechanosensitive ion channel family protein [Clostridiales bacterium]